MKLVSLMCLLGLLLFGCASSPADTNRHSGEVSETRDEHSYANINEIRTEHLHLDLEIDFDEKRVSGVARHQMSKSDADTAVFDVKGLQIEKITIGKSNEKETDFVIGEADEILGSPLFVKITPGTEFINIYYQTTKETEAIDWLPAELTASKIHPYMYTQGQAILTRSWIPIQDTPMNRITYSADVKVPSDLLAIMSANNPKEKSSTGEYHFEMKQRIPAYLIAIAVGDIVYNSLGDNCGVYSEPAYADDCAFEFTDMPKMIEAAENLYGEYRWEQFDIVILPYSFPFGGMENPRLTFANPTLIAGDQSLVTVIAHELAHSWSGNLVTNSTWDDFWLNEGFTVYFENRIMEELYGKETADILAVIERQELDTALEEMENDGHSEDTHLKLHLHDRSPDDGMTDIAYNKGAYFLRTLEHVAGREKFDTFLRNYFDSHAFETISTEEFVNYLDSELLEPNSIDFNVEEWIYQPGLPNNCVNITSSRLNRMIKMAEDVNNGKDIFMGSDGDLKRSDFITQEWQAFIRGLSTDISIETMIKIDEKLHFSDQANRQLKVEWYQLAVRVGNKSVRPEMKEHLVLVGRRWYIERIYQALKDSDDPDDLVWAKQVYDEAKNNYHFVSKSTIEEILYN